MLMYCGTQKNGSFPHIEQPKFEFNLELLLVGDGSRDHYVLITNYKGLIHKYIQKKTTFRKQFLLQLFSY